MEWEKTCTKHTSVKRLISKIYWKYKLRAKKKKLNNPIYKGAKILNRLFFDEKAYNGQQLLESSEHY